MQAKQVFEHYQNELPAKYMHYNFMARGEALANQQLITNGDEVLLELGRMALQNKVKPKFNVSTIMPKSLKTSLVDIFPLTQPTIYYSLYSMDPAFRKKWVPASMNPMEALDQLKEYQNLTKKIIKIHFAFIAGENDSIESIQEMCNELNKRNLICEFNLVRYNPFSPDQGSESSEEVLQKLMEVLTLNFKGKVQMIPRVGFDVKASCGMFVK